MVSYLGVAGSSALPLRAAFDVAALTIYQAQFCHTRLGPADGMAKCTKVTTGLLA